MNMKVCDKCGRSFPRMWKAGTKDHGPMCRNCWLNHLGETRPRVRGKAYYRIKPIGDKKMAEYAVYRPLRDKFLRENKFCEIKAPGCTIKATQVHHKKPRAHYLCDVSIFAASCTNCNLYVESHDAWARERGFKLNHL